MDARCPHAKQAIPTRKWAIPAMGRLAADRTVDRGYRPAGPRLSGRLARLAKRRPRPTLRACLPVLTRVCSPPRLARPRLDLRCLPVGPLCRRWTAGTTE